MRFSKFHILRQVLAALASLTVLVTTGAARAEELQKIKVTIPVSSVVFYPLYAAVAEGYFAKHGLDVDIISTSGDGPDVDALISGSVDFTVSTPNRLMTANQQGRPLLGVMNLGNRMAVDCWMNKEVARPLDMSIDEPLQKRIESLRGLTVAGTRPGSFTYLTLLAYAKRFDLEPQHDIHIVGVGGPAMIGAVEHKEVAVACSTSPLPQLAVSRGTSIMLTDNAAGKDPAYDNFLFELLYVRPDYAKAHPATVKKMTAALLESVAFMKRTPLEAQLPILRKYFAGVPDDVLIQSLNVTRQTIPADGRITDEAVNKAANFLIETGAITSAPAANTITSNAFLP